LNILSAVLCNLTARYAGLLLVSFLYWGQVVFRIVDPGRLSFYKL